MEENFLDQGSFFEPEMRLVWVDTKGDEIAGTLETPVGKVA
jgi:hypothetical protein